MDLVQYKRKFHVPVSMYVSMHSLFSTSIFQSLKFSKVDQVAEMGIFTSSGCPKIFIRGNFGPML